MQSYYNMMPGAEAAGQFPPDQMMMMQGAMPQQMDPMQQQQQWMQPQEQGNMMAPDPQAGMMMPGAYGQQQNMGSFSGMPQAEGNGRPMSRTTVYVGGLSEVGETSLVDEAALHNFFFSRCGSIQGIRMLPERGCCFVDFESEIAAATAVSLNGTYVPLRADSGVTTRIMVRSAYERPARAGGPPQQSGAAAGYSMMPDGSWGAGGGGSWQQGIGSGGGGWPSGDPAAQYWDPQQQQQSGWGCQQSAPRRRSPSPPRIPRFPGYTESENRAFKELLKLSVVEMEVADANEAILPPGRGAGRRGDGAGRFGPVGAGSLERAVHTVAHWMGTGVCDKRTADNFYVYLQGFHAKLKELRALDAERTKQRHEEDAVHLNTLFVKCNAVQEAFQAAGVQKVKDVFSKVQRKNVEKWTLGTAEVTESFRLLLLSRYGAGPEQDMDLEAAGAAEMKAPPPPVLGEEKAPPPPSATPVPPPPPSSAAGAATADTADGGAKRPRSEDSSPSGADVAPGPKDSGMDSLSLRIGMLERMLMEKLSGDRSSDAKQQPAAAAASDVLDQKPVAVPSPAPAAVDPATACTVAALSVYLATLPRGATFRQLCVYVHTLCHGPGTVAANDQTIDQLVGAALHLAPGVFAETLPEQGSVAAAESVWCLQALSSLPNLLKSMKGGE